MDISTKEKAEAVALAALQVEVFISLLEERYNLRPNEVVEAVTWVRERKLMSDRLKMAGTLSILATVVGGIILALWEGFKAMVNYGHLPK